MDAPIGGWTFFSEAESFGALYLAMSAETCLGEIYCHITLELLPMLND